MSAVQDLKFEPAVCSGREDGNVQGQDRGMKGPRRDRSVVSVTANGACPMPIAHSLHQQQFAGDKHSLLLEPSGFQCSAACSSPMEPAQCTHLLYSL